MTPRPTFTHPHHHAKNPVGPLTACMALAPRTPQTDALERDLVETLARHGYPGATVTFYDPPQKAGEIGIRVYLAEAWRPK